jgi:hypothetical protein
MIYETDPTLDADAQKYSCYALSIAHWNPDISDEEFNAAWESAKARGYLDPDDVLVSPQGFVDLLEYPLKLRRDALGSSHYPLDAPLDPEHTHIICEWNRGDPNGTVTHFVVMAHGGTTAKDVTYDPIQGGSRTVREGYPVSYRLFDVV